MCSRSERVLLISTPGFSQRQRKKTGHPRSFLGHGQVAATWLPLEDDSKRGVTYYNETRLTSTTVPSVWSRCHQLELRRYRTWISSSRPSGFSRFHLFPLQLCAPPSPTFLLKPTLVSCSDVHFSRRLPRPRSLRARQRLYHLSNIKHHLDWRSTSNCQLAGRWLVSFPRFVRHGDVLHLRGQC